jgi:hypothetical protein
VYIPENGEGGEGRSDVGVPEKTQKKPSENIYVCHQLLFYCHVSKTLSTTATRH